MFKKLTTGENFEVTADAKFHRNSKFLNTRLHAEPTLKFEKKKKLVEGGSYAFAKNSKAEGQS